METIKRFGSLCIGVAESRKKVRIGVLCSRWPVGFSESYLLCWQAFTFITRFPKIRGLKSWDKVTLYWELL